MSNPVQSSDTRHRQWLQWSIRLDKRSGLRRRLRKYTKKKIGIVGKKL